MRNLTFSRALACALAGAIGVGAPVDACSSKANPVGPGGECFLATECASGLVCVEQANHTRVCSSDLSRVAGRRPADDGAAADAAGEVDEDASFDAEAPPEDSSD